MVLCLGRLASAQVEALLEEDETTGTDGGLTWSDVSEFVVLSAASFLAPGRSPKSKEAVGADFFADGKSPNKFIPGSKSGLLDWTKRRCARSTRGMVGVMVSKYIICI
jgi:hypothetical protein